ncbi:MAG: hypothetical protein OXF41_09805 [bacterium]|nr:hypothetical protein [bacterium]
MTAFHDESPQADPRPRKIGVQLHYRNLGKTRRVETLEAIDRISGWGGYLFETARPLPDAHYSEHHVRAKVLIEAITHLSSEGVVEAVLETRAGTKKGLPTPRQQGSPGTAQS